MSVNLMLGINGAGKGYESAVHQILPALVRGRKVITNMALVIEAYGDIDPAYAALIELRTKPQLIRGTFDSTSEGSAFTIDPAIEAQGLRGDKKCFGNVWDYYSDWRHEDGFGPLFVIDECHNALPKIGTSAQVEEYYAIHRHFNVDLLLQTQSYGKINVPIKDLVKVCYKLRKATALGKEKSYIRRVFDGVRGSVIQETVREYQPQYFGLWRSHTQGIGIEEFAPDDVTPFYVRFKRFTRAVLAVFLIAAAYLGYQGYKAYTAPKGVKVVKTQTIGPPPGMVPLLAPAPFPDGAVFEHVPPEPEPATDAPLIPEPYASKGLHLTGFMSMAGRTIYTIGVSQNGVLISGVTDAELARVGYVYKPLSDCAGVLMWGGKARAITCDVPQVGSSLNAGASKT
jgi:zona occludens toxin